MKKFLKVVGLIIGLVGLFLVTTFFIRPSFFVDFYVESKTGDIFIETKPSDFSIRLTNTGEISARSNRHLHWSPSKKYVSYSERVLDLENSPEYYNKYWAIKLLNPRTMKIKTIAVIDYHFASHAWFDDETIRIFKSFGSGVGGYIDIKIHTKEPVVTSDSNFDKSWNAMTLEDMDKMIEELNGENNF